MGKRIPYLDIAKGISILLMTFTHLVIITKHPAFVEFNNHFLRIFKVPLFIMISGYLYTGKTLQQFVKTKADGLVKPFAVIFIITAAALAIFFFASGHRGLKPLILLIIDRTAAFYYPLWFVFSLFCGLVTFRCADYLIDNFPYSISVPGILYIGILLSLFDIFAVQWHIFNLATVRYFVLYLFIGYLFRKFEIIAELLSFKSALPIASIYCTYLFIAYQMDINLDLFQPVMKPFALALIFSVAGFITIIGIANFLSTVPYLPGFLTLCAKSSFFILAFHVGISNYILNPFFEHAGFTSGFFDVLNFIITITCCILLYLSVKAISPLAVILLPRKKSGD